MENLFWIAFTALCVLGLVVMVPYGMWAYSEEAKK